MNSRYLITGGAGTIGSELLKELINTGDVVCVLDNNEDGLFTLEQAYSSHPFKKNLRFFLGDIRDSDRLERAFDGVTDIFHCAALKHVYLSEYNPFDAVKTNIEGVTNIIQNSIKQRVKRVVFTSSDKAVNPTSAMGATKLLGERLVVAANSQVGSVGTRFSCVRFGNVLNSKGSVLKIFERQLQCNQPLTITSLEMSRYLITMRGAVELCLFANRHMIGGEIFMSDMGAADIFSLAKAFCGAENFEYKIIGEKIGEKLYEELVTEVEFKRTIKYLDKLVVLPEESSPFYLDWIASFQDKYGVCEKINVPLRSDKNLIDYETLCSLLKEAA